MVGKSLMSRRFRVLPLFHSGKRLDDSARKIHYMGSSMGHTFRPGDLLYVVPYGEKRIRCVVQKVRERSRERDVGSNATLEKLPLSGRLKKPVASSGAGF